MYVKVKKLHPQAILPQRQTTGSSGFDLHVLDAVTWDCARAPYDDHFTSITICPGDRILVRTGIALQLELGMEGQVRPRSGLALRHGITLLNTPGTIDADYRGDIGLILINLGQQPVEIGKGERVGQLVIQPVWHQLQLVEIEELELTQRGTGGFGHTGV
ncbi:dUTP diphosphatase [Heliophilum fasciatum]|uniref:Deoxyuridine 5'-triphosphate nucleotidohydrolase n=1 Tax=Heliophilum fasciatum TaxID=35700 RepID=A0A4R2RF25_9FIRM|nr:dUTP diphosphatase [Heliophilum fasciatum]MCW2279170.1 dUTP pyrophosphatase [Heliophilum fasciatum]TCP61028.1 deoxyuridine 5'-triphosphate nucleotidohydrolase [Heliophilum fasciatum]